MKDSTTPGFRPLDLNMGEANSLRRAVRRRADFQALPPSARILYEVLWDLSWTGIGVALSTLELSTEAGLPPRTVQFAARALHDAGFIFREVRKVAKDRNASSVYHLSPLADAAGCVRVDATDCAQERIRIPDKRKDVARVPSAKPPGTLATVSISTQEDKTVKKLRTDTSETLFREDPREGTGKSPQKPDPGARVAAATARLADPDHWVRKLARAKSAGAVLAAYWVDKRTVAEPDVQPPRADGRIIGQAGHIVARFLVPGVTVQAAFDKARRIIDCAFARECWPFRGETSPVELSSLDHRAVFDRLRAHLGERIHGPPPVLTQEERNARVRAEIDAENERNGFGKRRAG